ncbi:N-acetylmannosamine kinase [Vibrio kyushuensis]|uniref:N-acetylmannosamine kinase n=1 Tax=Vibrio kyushuensis TaxID=2910249 RepID=UPI003D0AC47F
MKTCLAVDIGGTKIAAALIQSGQILKLKQLATPSSDNPDELTRALRELVTPLYEQADYLAVASTGIIDEGILTALNPNNLGGLNQYPIAEVFEHLCHRPVMVINDAQAAAWAEYQLLDSMPSSMGFITVSTGVGAGFVINEELVTGLHGIAGHAGHTLADPNGPMCGCGRQGCVESIASGTAIGKAGQLYFGDECTGEMVFTQYLDGDSHAKDIVENAAKTIANLVADLKISLDLQVICLGGSVGLAPKFLSLVQHYLKQLPPAYQIEVIHAHSGANAGLIGVASWAEHFFQQTDL